MPSFPPRHIVVPILAALSALALVGCGSTPAERPAAVVAEAPLRSGTLTDFSGHWEKNYQLSDDFNTRFQLYVADIQRRFTQGGSLEQGGVGAGRGANTDAINGLARFAEELTRMPLLDIVQDEQHIDIERQDDFNLRCQYNDRLYVQSSNAFGNDLCDWTQERLLFQMRLAGGLEISHQLSLSPDNAMLNVTTTVSSDTVNVPVVISNYYTRYTPPDDNFNCQLTLTRNTVCSQRGEAK